VGAALAARGSHSGGDDPAGSHAHGATPNTFRELIATHLARTLAQQVRATGSCNITTSAGTVQGIPIRYCRALHRADGYTYQKGAAARPPAA
jgi:hypothetical protein